MGDACVGGWVWLGVGVCMCVVSGCARVCYCVCALVQKLTSCIFLCLQIAKWSILERDFSVASGELSKFIPCRYYLIPRPERMWSGAEVAVGAVHHLVNFVMFLSQLATFLDLLRHVLNSMLPACPLFL